MTSGLEDLILAGIARDVAHWQTRQHVPSFGPHRAGRKHNRRIAHARRHSAVDVDLIAWLGREPSGADRKAASRALESLEQRGLVVRIGRRRTVAVELTSDGAIAAGAHSELDRREN